MARRSPILEPKWDTEAALVADFNAWAREAGWTPYPETAGWDVLLVRDSDGFQIGVEAKLRLNVEVLCQALSREHPFSRGVGPDCRCVLVPNYGAQAGLQMIARHLGIVVVTASRRESWRGGWEPKARFQPDLPGQGAGCGFSGSELSSRGWPELCPDERHALPAYVPDVNGGESAPIALTHWKIQAIKAAIVIELVGYITRADFKALKIDPSRWTGYWLVSIGDKRWAPHERHPPPNFKAQHPLNYAQIRADIETWRTGVPSLDGWTA